MLRGSVFHVYPDEYLDGLGELVYFNWVTACFFLDGLYLISARPPIIPEQAQSKFEPLDGALGHQSSHNPGPDNFGKPCSSIL